MLIICFNLFAANTEAHTEAAGSELGIGLANTLATLPFVGFFKIFMFIWVRVIEVVLLFTLVNFASSLTVKYFHASYIWACG